MTKSPDHLERYRTLATALDAKFRIPFTPIRFGWDAIIGLIPGIGDAAGGLIGAYGLWVGTRLGAPLVVLARMLANLLIDIAAGAFPLLGDMFDVAWRGNLRNLALLERWVEQPRQTRQRSVMLFAGLVGLLLIAGLGAVWIGWQILQLIIPRN